MSLLVTLLLGGCAAKPAVKPASGAYFGPTEAADVVIAKINSRNAAIPTLWAMLDHFDVWAVNPQSGKSDYFNGDGYLFYRAPAEFRFRGKKPGAGLVFEVGLNRERYWLAAPSPGPDAMWWGHVGAAVDPAAEIPIRPELMRHVLALGSVETNPASRLYPLVRFNNDHDAYMLLFCRPAGERLLVEKEVWYDRQTLNPKLVILFDADGRAVLRAYLKNHRPVEGAGDQAPLVAADYDLFFPPTRSRMIVQLESLRLQNNGAPNDASFVFPGTDIVGTVRNIDAKPLP